MWELEYAMLFGVPGNKLELSKGRSRWAFPFMTRELAETHFAQWLETLTRWQRVTEQPHVRKGRRRWQTKINGVSMRLFPRPIEFRIPISWKAFDAFHNSFSWPEMWPGEPPWHKSGLLASMDHSDVQMHLWSLFGEFCHRHGGQHAGRVAIALSDTAVVEPDQFYFAKSRDECMIERDYFFGVPNLIAEIISPASWMIDRGLRKELYRRSGVPHLWLLDPERETVEVYDLLKKRYSHLGTYGAGAEFQSVLFPDETIQVDRLFQTQSKRHGDRPSTAKRKPIPEWIVSPEKQLGLQYFFLLGHPERRWEIWGNRAPSVLAFGSSKEAKFRLDYFLQEACAWEGVAKVSASALADEVEQAEVGRFRFTRSGRHVHMDIAVDARKYRELLAIWRKHAAWDWGEK